MLKLADSGVLNKVDEELGDRSAAEVAGQIWQASVGQSREVAASLSRHS